MLKLYSGIMKKKKKLKLNKENIFIAVSIIFLLGSTLFYGGRFIYFYRLENVPKKEVITNLNELLISKEVFADDGLYKDDDVYYFKGKNVNNYLLYSGRIFRIVGIDSNGGIKLISDEVSTVIYDGSDENVDSYVDDWLNNVYLNTLNKDYLVDTLSCDDKIDNNITCKNIVKETISSLSLYDYMKAGDVNSYLNSGNYFWLSSKKSDNTTWYISNEGASSTTSNKVSLGVRPVITLKSDLVVVSGDGSIDDPYTIENLVPTKLGDIYVGSYVTFSNHLFRVMSNGDTTRLVMMDEMDKHVFSTYTNVFETTRKNSLAYYLNKDFYNTLNTDFLIKSEFYDGIYERYYKEVESDSVKAYVGLPSVGDILFGDNYLLLTPTGEATQAIYAVNNGRLSSVDINEEYNYQPVIVLDSNILIASGSGTSSDSYILK